MKKIVFHDTTLRDGEQAPKINFNLEQKIDIALQLEKLGVQNIETGFVASSEADYVATREISKLVKNSSVATLCRCVEKDIDISWEALKNAEEPQILLFMPASDIHIQHKLNKNREEVMQIVERCVRHAKRLFPKVTFGAEDATRSDLDYLARLVCIAADNGADCISVGDTVGIISPMEVKTFCAYLQNQVYNRYEGIEFEVHFHNDLGLSTANVIEALKYDVNRVSGTINGIGERAGNVALEQVIMILFNKKDVLGTFPDINMSELSKTCDLVGKYANLELNAMNSVMKKEYVTNILNQNCL